MIEIVKTLIFVFFFAILSACTNLPINPPMEKSHEASLAEMNIQSGMMYLKRGKIRIAQRKLQTALQLDPKLPEAWYSMGYFLEKTGHRQQATQYYLNAVALGANRGDVQNNYGTFLCRSGRYQEAIEHFLMAARDSQYHDVASAYENAGLCALKVPDRMLAQKYFHLAVEKDPTRKVSRVQLAKLKASEIAY